MMNVRNFVIGIFVILFSNNAFCSQLIGEIKVLCVAQTGDIVFFLRKSEKSDSVINISVFNEKLDKLWELQKPEQAKFGDWTIIQYADWSIRPNGQIIAEAKQLLPNAWYEVRYLGYGILGRLKFKYQRPGARSCTIEVK